ASFVDIVRKPALSGANLVPLVVSNGRLERPNSLSSLRGSCAWPWASWNLIWRPKKILKQHQEIFKNKSVLSINGASAHVLDDSRLFRDNSFSGNNYQLFRIPGQNCKRDFLSFRSKFENVSWEFSPQLWFKAARLLPAGGPSPQPFFNNFGEFAQAVLSRSGSSPSMKLALFTKASSSSLPWAIPMLSSPHLRGECSSRPRLPPSEVLEGMAFHRVDPAPFLPHGFVAQQVDQWEIVPQDEDPVPPYPHDGHQLPVEYFGLGQPVANFQFDLNIPPWEELKRKPSMTTTSMMVGMPDR
ncbi:hypothetical protein ACJX0J_041531, partial [Zea mays]